MTHYTAGYRLENDVVNLYRNKQWFATRSAGSHSPVDVIAMRAGEIHLIQCCTNKKGKTKGELSILKALADENNCRAFFAYRDKGVKLEEVLP